MKKFVLLFTVIALIVAMATSAYAVPICCDAPNLIWYQSPSQPQLINTHTVYCTTHSKYEVCLDYQVTIYHYQQCQNCGAVVASYYSSYIDERQQH